MDKRDQKAFKEMINTLCEVTGKDKFGTSALNLYFSVLERFPIDAVEIALGQCAIDPDVGFGINPAIILKHLGASQAVPETVVTIQAKAKVKKCPLGIMAAAYMQPRSFIDMNSFERNQLAAEFLELLPNMELEIQQNGYTDRQMQLLVDYKIDIYSPFRPGIAGPIDQNKSYSQFLKIESKTSDESARQEAYALTHSSVSEADMAAAKIRIAEDMASIQPKSKDLINLEAAEVEAYRVVDLNELVGGEL